MQACFPLALLFGKDWYDTSVGHDTACLDFHGRHIALDLIDPGSGVRSECLLFVKYVIIFRACSSSETLVVRICQLDIVSIPFSSNSQSEKPI